MSILIEGVDKVGKTTLAKLIAEALQGSYYHFVKPEPGVDHVEQFIGALNELPYNTVFDRGCLSGFAYDYKAATDETRVITSVESLEKGMKALASQLGLLIYATADDEDLVKRFRAEGDANNYVNEREIIVTSNIYDLMFRYFANKAVGSVPHYLVFDSSGESAEDFVTRNVATLDIFLRGWK